MVNGVKVAAVAVIGTVSERAVAAATAGAMIFLMPVLSVASEICVTGD